MNEKGIEHQFMMPGTPQQNGKAKWFNCTNMDKAMSMLHQAGLSNGFWEHAVSTVVHIYNHTPIHLLEWKTPHEKWNPGKVPDVSYFCIFGCKAYMHVPADKCQKLGTPFFSNHHFCSTKPHQQKWKVIKRYSLHITSSHLHLKPPKVPKYAPFQ